MCGITMCDCDLDIEVLRRNLDDLMSMGAEASNPFVREVAEDLCDAVLQRIDLLQTEYKELLSQLDSQIGEDYARTEMALGLCYERIKHSEVIFSRYASNRRNRRRTASKQLTVALNRMIPADVGDQTFAAALHGEFRQLFGCPKSFSPEVGATLPVEIDFGDWLSELKSYTSIQQASKTVRDRVSTLTASLHYGSVAVLGRQGGLLVGSVR